ncbi:MAG: hypothetical protein WCW25_05215 [Patescibacteria group bacterium]|jgi:hypothetical protein
MVKKSKLFSLLLILPLATLILSGCGKSASELAGERAAEKSIENQLGGQADVDINNGNIKVESEQGNIETGDSVKLPDDFPSDVYVIDGKIIVATSNQAEKSFMLSIDATTGLEEAYSVYQEKFKAAGWQLTGTMNFGDSASVVAEKDKRAASIYLSRNGDKTNVVVGVAEN